MFTDSTTLSIDYLVTPCTVQHLEYVEYSTCNMYGKAPGMYTVQHLEYVRHNICNIYSTAPGLCTVQHLEYVQYSTWDMYGTALVFWNM